MRASAGARTLLFPDQMNMFMVKTVLPMGLLAVVLACSGPDTESTQAGEAAPVTYVDSIFPIEEEIRRFRASLPDSVDALAGGAESIEALAGAFLTALEQSDLEAIEALVITPEEFAYLYYPHTQYTRRPYEMAPNLLWFQLENYGEAGLRKAFSRFGGQPFGSFAVHCREEPEAEGENLIWSGCLVAREGSGADEPELSLFGPIIERQGRFKFISLANRL